MALPSAPRSMRNPRTSLDVNVVGTHNMLMATRAAGVARFSGAASSSAYGAGEELPKRETDAGPADQPLRGGQGGRGTLRRRATGRSACRP